MSAALIALLTVIGQIAPALGSSAAIQGIISTLIGILPTLVQEVEDVVPIVKNIIGALQSNSAITPEQTVALQNLDAQADAGFEGAAAGYNPDGTLVEPPPA